MLQLFFESEESGIFAHGSRPRITKLTYITNNPQWSFNLHTHSDILELAYIAGGEGIYSLDNKEYKTAKGDIVVINSGMVHAVTSNMSKPLEVYTLQFQDCKTKDFGDNKIFSPSACPVLHQGEYQEEIVFNLIKLIFDQRTQTPDVYQSVCLGAASLLLTLLYQNRPLAETTMENAKLSFAGEVLDYINKHFNEKISLSALSEAFHISASHISHEMLNVYGISPINYLIKKRIDEAKWMLVATDLSVNQISQRVGYENAYHFTNLFFKQTGLHPLKYRECYSEKQTKE